MGALLRVRDGNHAQILALLHGVILRLNSQTRPAVACNKVRILP